MKCPNCDSENVSLSEKKGWCYECNMCLTFFNIEETPESKKASEEFMEKINMSKRIKELEQQNMDLVNKLAEISMRPPIYVHIPEGHSFEFDQVGDRSMARSTRIDIMKLERKNYKLKREVENYFKKFKEYEKEIERLKEQYKPAPHRIIDKDGWIGVDLDKTLAYYDELKEISFIGKPIIPMVERVKEWLDCGHQVKIFTARISGIGKPDLKTGKTLSAFDVIKPIEEWCEKYIGQILPVTNIKDWKCEWIWDDKAAEVEPNTGRAIGTAAIQEE